MALWKSQMEDHTFDWLRVVPIFGLGQTINGLDVCVDLKGFSPWTQTVMVYFVPGHAVIDATHRKRVKYEAKAEDEHRQFCSVLCYRLSVPMFSEGWDHGVKGGFSGFPPGGREGSTTCRPFAF
nr:hypothetical protein [Tanacetum cinerariifolium]